MSGAKFAVAECAVLIDSWHVGAVPEQSPDQPVNIEPGSAVVARVTDAPTVNACEHVEGQRIPAGLLVTTPLPVPPVDTVSTGSRVNVATAE